MISKILNKWNNAHILQKIYVILWFLFLALLFVWVFTAAFLPHPTDVDAQNVRANIIAGIALVMTIVLFSAIILTVLTNGFILKNKSLFKNKFKGGVK